MSVVIDLDRSMWPSSASSTTSCLSVALIAHIADAHGGEGTFVDASRRLHLRVTMPLWSST